MSIKWAWNVDRDANTTGITLHISTTWPHGVNAFNIVATLDK
jgi:hypothetical protein